MEGKKLIGFVVIMAIFLIVFIAVCILCSCNTKQKVVTEYVAVHDTIHSHHTDTLHDVRVVTLNDTVRIVEWHELTVNNEGDTIKEVHHYYDKQTTILVDSTNRYKARMDSLEKALTVEKNKEKTIRYSIPRWLIATLVIIFIGLYIYILTRYRKKYSN